MTQIGRAFIDITAVDGAVIERTASDALLYWREQEDADQQAAAFRADETVQLPSGWWMIPAFVSGLGIWGMIFGILLG